MSKIVRRSVSGTPAAVAPPSRLERMSERTMPVCSSVRGQDAAASNTQLPTISELKGTE